MTLLSFTDQFAFRPSGSTTAALITILHTITNFLTINEFVIVLALDFSKAFDTVRHSTLLNKYSQMDIPDHIYNWLVEYFHGHSHCTEYRGQLSALHGRHLYLVCYVTDFIGCMCLEGRNIS